MADIALAAGQATVRGMPSFSVTVDATGENRRRKVAAWTGIPQASGTAGAEVTGAAVALEGGVEAPYAANGGTLAVPRRRRFVGHTGFLAVLRAAADSTDEKGSAFLPLGGGGVGSVAEDAPKRYYPIGNETGDAVAVEYRLNPSTTDDTDELRIVHVGSLDARDVDEVVVDLYEAQSAPSEGSQTTGNGLTSDQLHKLESIQTGAEVNVQTDWNETDAEADAYLKNKPTLFSGDFNDLSNVPDTAEQWPDYGDITGQKPPVNAEPNPTSIPWNLLTGVPSFASRWADWAEVTGKPTLRNPGDAFVAGVLVGATREKLQDILDSFTTGGWADVAGTIASVPAVGVATRATQFSATDIKAAAYALSGSTGPRLENRYLPITVPVDYEYGLARLRLRIGVGPGDYDENEPVENQWLPLSGQNVAHITSDANYRYYAIFLADIPAATNWIVQVNDRWEINENVVAIPRLTVQEDGDTQGTAESINTLNFTGAGIGVAIDGGKATVTNTPPTLPSLATQDAMEAGIDTSPVLVSARLVNDAIAALAMFPYPAAQPFESGKEGRVQIEQHETIRPVNRMIAFPELRTNPYVPPGQGGTWDGTSTIGTTAVQIPGVGRITYYPTTHYETALRGIFTFTPQSEYQRGFGANRLVMATDVDGANTQTMALTAGAHGRFNSAAASAANRITTTQTAEQRQRWFNLINAAGNYEYNNQDDVRNRYLTLTAFAKEVLLRSQRTPESIARPATGWPNSNVYVHAATTPMPFQFSSAMDDALWFQIGFTGATGYEIHASHGVAVWSPWVSCQLAKQWPRLASPYATGGENYAPRYNNDESTRYDQAVNAVKAVGHNRMELTMRIGTDNYPRFHASDGWARLGKILLRYSPIPIQA